MAAYPDVRDVGTNTKPTTTGTEIGIAWRSLVPAFTSSRPHTYPMLLLLIMFMLIVVAGEVSKAFGVVFDSTASVQVDPRIMIMSPNRSSTKQVVIYDNTRHLLASQLLDPFQLGAPSLRSS